MGEPVEDRVFFEEQLACVGDLEILCDQAVSSYWS